MDYKEDYRVFLDGFLTPELKEKYQIKSIEKTNVCWRGKGILAPFIVKKKGRDRALFIMPLMLLLF